MLFKAFVREYAGGADFNQVSTEFVFKHAVFGTTEIDMIVGAHGIQIGAASIILIKTHTPVAMNAPVHFVIQEGTQVLRSEEHTSELQSLMRISYAVFCLKKNK